MRPGIVRRWFRGRRGRRGRRALCGWCALFGLVAIGLTGSLGPSAAADPRSPGGPPAAAASCVGLTARQEFRSARLVFDAVMLAGPTVPYGDRRVLSSPARARVIRYLKGRGPRTVRVDTAVSPRRDGVAVDSEGILPRAGERWRIYADRARQPLPTSDCNGSRRLRPLGIPGERSPRVAARQAGPSHAI